MLRTSALLVLLASAISLVPAPVMARGPSTESPSVTKRLAIARSTTLALQTDAAEMTETARSQPDLPPQSAIVSRITGDMLEAERNAKELLELRTGAEPPASRLEYVSAHQEITDHLATLIFRAMDELTTR